ncbi:hypothetical protein CASFOL_036478 [Castilleja foliolosa]|uniref:AT-rich interactive domain-containing protein 5 n=2 Tax=Orobanchaceae TaxID=91896 RepID=A0ABD3BX96_9LAMI
MSRSDLEIEGAEKLPNDPGNNLQEFGSKVVDANVESKEEKFAVSGDVSERENGEEDLNKCKSEEKDNTEVNTEAEDQTIDKSEANEEGSVHEQISTIIKAEEPTDPTSAVEEQTNTVNEVIEQIEVNGGSEKENSMANDMDYGSHVKEHTSEDDTTKNPHVPLGEKTVENADAGNSELPTNEAPQGQKVELDDVRQGEDAEMKDASDLDKDTPVKDSLIEQRAETVDGNDQTVVSAAKHDGKDALLVNQLEAVTPDSLVKYSSAKAGDHSGETFKTAHTQATLPLMGESDDGTLEEQIAFMKELESFHREKALDFKPPKFYQQPLNCLKLWRAVIRLGGYDTVTGQKLWRQVGESFHPPKTCTTVSWTFRIFYEKSLLEYERHKTLSGELQLPVPTPPEAPGVDGEGSGYQGSGPGRARRDSAARAMQGWHVQRLSGHDEDKNLSNMAKRDKNLKSIGSLKQKRPNEMENSNKVARTEISKQLVSSVVDVGPPADWVKVNVRQTKDCFEVYALVPGLLREEVRVQSDPAGRVVITGQPEQVDNPWGITPFKKVISLPTRIDPLETSAVVSLHGRLFVRVPFEQSK